MEIIRNDIHDIVYLTVVCNKEEADVICSMDHIVKSSNNDPIIRIIENEIILKFGYNFIQLNTESRKREYVKPRQVSMYLLKEYTKLSLGSIAFIFGQTHGNALHAIKIVENFMDTENEYKEMIEELKNKIDARI